MDLRYYLRVLSRRKWLILAVVLTAAAATFIVSLLLPSTYEAEARFFTGIANTYTVPSFEEEKDPTDIQYEIETQLLSLEQQILSQQVLSLVACELILHDLDPQNEPFRNLEGLNTTYSLTDLKNAQKFYQTRLDSLQPLIATGGARKVYGDILKFMGYDINSLLRDLTTERTPGTDVILIRYTSADPELSAFTVNALGNQFGRYYETQLVERNRNSISYFSGLAKQNREDLGDVISSQEDFVDIMKNYSSGDARRILSRIRHLERLRLEEESQIRSLVKSLDIINEQLGPTGNTISSPSAYADAIAKQRNRVNQYRRRLIRKVTFDEPFNIVEDSLNQESTLLDRQLYQFTKNSISNLLPAQERLKLLHNDRRTALKFARENLQQIDASLSLTRNQTFTQ
ncbi:MAG: Wzz/FepE/Etk N-terminal domain-containing protein, partial [Bacteroidota bacterium]